MERASDSGQPRDAGAVKLPGEVKLRLGGAAYGPYIDVFQGLQPYFWRQGLELYWVLYSGYDALVDALRDKKPLPDIPDDEALVISYGTEFFQTRQVSQGAFDGGLKQFGARGLTELTTLMGYYALLAFNANAFQIDLPEERTEALLPL